MTDIWVAIVSAIGGIIVGLFSIISSNNVVKVELKNMREMFDRLEKKVEKHNNLVEKVAVLRHDLDTAFMRIDELRDSIREGERK